MKQRKHYLLIAIQGIILALSLAIVKLVFSFMVESLLRSLLQGVAILILFYFINKHFLKVKVSYYNKGITLKKQLVSLIPLWLFILWANIPLLFDAKQEYLFPAFVLSAIAGILEEYIIRGLFLGYLEDKVIRDIKSLWWSLILTSLIFGLAHTSNLLHQPVEYTLFQIFSSGLAGLFYGAIYLRTRSLIWVIFAHFLQDFAAIASQGLSYATNQEIKWSFILITLILFGSLSAILLRPKKMRSLMRNNND